MIKKIFFSLIFIFVINCISAQNNSLQTAVNRLKYDRDLRYGSVGILIIDLETNDTLAALNPNLVLKPASTLKLMTTATALDLFGKDYKFKTILGYTGKIDTDTHTLNGDLIIKGYGDPTLASKYFDETNQNQHLSQWLKALQNAGIDTINGRIIADASYFSYDIVPPTWTWEDIGNYYGAGPCGLNIHDNLYTIHFYTSRYSGRRTKIKNVEPAIPGLTFDNKVISANIRSDKSYIYGSPYTYFRYIRGRLPRGRNDFKVKGSMPDPALFSAQELDSFLVKNNIFIKDNATTFRILKDTLDLTNFKTLDTLYSIDLQNIITKTNYKSINLFAEVLLLQIGKKLANIDNTEDAADTLIYYWKQKGMNTANMALYDGSGLSPYDAVSAAQLMYVLDYMHDKSPNFETFYNSLPVSGESGTLKYICRNNAATGKIHGKSGSVKRVRCYAGYTTSASGRQLGFVFILNNFSCSDKTAKKKLENLMEQMVLFNE